MTDTGTDRCTECDCIGLELRRGYISGWIVECPRCGNKEVLKE